MTILRLGQRPAVKTVKVRSGTNFKRDFGSAGSPTHGIRWLLVQQLLDPPQRTAQRLRVCAGARSDNSGRLWLHPAAPRRPDAGDALPPPRGRAGPGRALRRHRVARAPRRFLHRFYTAFAVLAPLPSIVLAGHYARLVVQARHALGFSRAEPCIEPLRRNLQRAVKQAILIAGAVAPISRFLHLMPGVG